MHADSKSVLQGDPWLLKDRVMASPVFVGALSLEDVLDLSADELRDELLGRYIDPKGMSKVQMQKALMEGWSPVHSVAPVVSQPVSPRAASEQQMELEVMTFKMDSQKREEVKV